MLFKHLTKNAKERDRSVVVWVMRPGRFRNGYDERELPGTGYLAMKIIKYTWALCNQATRCMSYIFHGLHILWTLLMNEFVFSSNGNSKLSICI